MLHSGIILADSRKQELQKQNIQNTSIRIPTHFKVVAIIRNCNNTKKIW